MSEGTEACLEATVSLSGRTMEKLRLPVNRMAIGHVTQAFQLSWALLALALAPWLRACVIDPDG